MYIFCIPYAGGSAFSYSSWKKFEKDGIEFVPIEFPGRGNFSQKKMYDSIQEAVEDIFYQISDKLDSEYAILGHSMGGLIGYELAKYISAKRGYKLPCNIFISAREAPNCSRINTKRYLLPEDEFKQVITRFSPDIDKYINNEIMYSYISNLLRNDLELLDRYTIDNEIIAINTDITVILGDDDYLTVKDVIEWKKYTNKECKIKIFKGNHFYFREDTEEVVSFIESVCKKYL